MNPPGPRRRFLRDLRRAASWHRRKLAVVAAMAAVLTAVAAAAPTGPSTSPVVRATSDLASGSIVRAGDITVSAVAEDALPHGALADPADVLGRRVSGPVADGQILAARHLLSTPSRSETGQVIAPLRLADQEVAALLQPGALIDVVAADTEGGGAEVIASGVKVLTVPPPPSDEGARTADGALVLIDVDTKTAALLVGAAASTKLSVLLR